MYILKEFRWKMEASLVWLNLIKPQFAALNVGFALDKKTATSNKVFDVFYCNRTSKL